MCNAEPHIQVMIPTLIIDQIKVVINIKQVNELISPKLIAKKLLRANKT